jgi:sec-independent protein translocase protein TatB|tara:strand:+ start:471 stop:713 length:243 start_codon:yes stop_codon:yes gene_type:complete
MPQIGWLEILIIVSIAIIVVGPKDFPIMLKKVGSWIGSVKRYISNVQTEVTSMDDDVKDIYDKTDESNQKHNLNEKKDVK